ncbi:hypothetical protein [Brucella sp. NBRC 113783]|uniref:hypothetical protein n=1 Tax=Brucella sp. NBRC 113783 TaxID=3075478 RepID=UPI0029C0B68C|nr:hypothetical protein [Brucella sp. NBRC 113783]MDX4074830.1 hypothetical protein [Brucella sp. NBRC 113783]
MKDFGKFTSSEKIVTVPSIQIGIDEDGEAVFNEPRELPVLIFRDSDGVDWFDLAKQFPHPFYIAIDDNSRIYSMETDFQACQLAGHLIGIDSDYGYTRGHGGTVYGKLWNGAAIIEPEPEPVVVIIPSVTLWERMTDNEAEQVNGVMATQSFRTRKIFETANTFRSDHELWPLLEQIATQLFGVERSRELLAPPL